MNYFEELNSINVNDKVEKKNNLSYLSWAYAWAELKKRHPYANYKVYETESGVNYFTDGRTCWVKVSVTVPSKYEDIPDVEHVEMLPVMDFRNNSITVDKVTSTDVNKAIQRALTKAIARHGLGLYVYAGEDLPDEPLAPCAQCGKGIEAGGGMTSAEVAEARTKKFGKPLCQKCANALRDKKEGAPNE